MGDLDNEVMRAIEQARMMFSAGFGLETVCTALADSDLGGVRKRFRGLVAKMREGEPARHVLEKAAKAGGQRSFVVLLESLLDDGPEVDHRLGEASRLLGDEKKIDVHKRMGQMQVFLYLAIMLLLLPIMFVFIVWVVTDPLPKAGINIQLSPMVRASFFGTLGGLYTFLCILIAGKA